MKYTIHLRTSKLLDGQPSIENKILLIDRSNSGLLKTDEYDEIFIYKGDHVARIKEQKNLPSVFLCTGTIGGYDTTDSMIVCAFTDDEALEICKKYATAEGAASWGIENIQEIAQECTEEIGIILTSFNAG